MKINRLQKILITISIICLSISLSFGEKKVTQESLHIKIDSAVEALMDQYDIPGMALGIVDADQVYFLNYGISNKKTTSPVTENTIFELGSISKTFTALLASYAVEKGAIDLSDLVSQHVPTLKNSPIGQVSLVQLGTYIAGGLPLQFPSDVMSSDEIDHYFESWHPIFPAGEERLYSNPSIGFFGNIAALSMNVSFTDLMEKTILDKLGLKDTFITVPQDKLAQYACGYNKNNDPVRVNPGALDAEAYGIKSTAKDMVRFIQSNLQMIALDETMEDAIKGTHKGQYSVSTFTQALGWEKYPLSSSLDELLQGNSNEVILNPQPILFENILDTESVWVNKTGSTGGFGAYIVFIPEKKVGIIILANKNYPNAERVKLAYDILSTLTD